VVKTVIITPAQNDGEEIQGVLRMVKHERMLIMRSATVERKSTPFICKPA